MGKLKVILSTILLLHTYPHTHGHDQWNFISTNRWI